MKIFSTEHIFRHPWDRVSIANWIKYPNDLTPHVINVDYISRHVDEQTGILHTERLLTCSQNVPAFISRMFGGENSTIFLERSQVDRQGRKLTLRTRNLSFCDILVVEEKCSYTQNDSGDTILRQTASIKSFVAWQRVANRMEDFVVGRFHANAMKGRLALEQAVERIYQDTKDQVLETLSLLNNSSTNNTNSGVNN